MVKVKKGEKKRGWTVQCNNYNNTTSDNKINNKNNKIQKKTKTQE